MTDVVIAIDPGSKESAYVLWDGETILAFGKQANSAVLEFCGDGPIVIEMVASYGMAVGKDVFETVFWIGRFCERANSFERVYRKEVKMNLCHSMKASDSNIVTALVDRFDPDRQYGKYGKGIKNNPGPFYGFYKDIWQAFALAVTWRDITT